MSSRPPLLLLLLALLAVAPHGTAQRPPSWVAAPVTGAVPPTAVNHLGKLLWFVRSGQVHVFSAATRSWAAHTLVSGATIRTTNDVLLIDEGTSITALSSARGSFETIQVSAQAIVLNPPTARNDGILLVLDGTTLWSFTGFTGSWNQTAVPPTAAITVNRNVALVADGTSLWAMSSLFGSWVTTTTSSVLVALGVGDTVGWASDGVDAFGFSAIRNTWTAAALPPGGSPVPSAERDVAVWAGPFEILGFGGVRGAFDRTFPAQVVTVDLSDHLAHAYSADARQHWLFSVPHARWTAFQTTHPATAHLGEATALLLEPTEVHAYSALNAGVTSISLAATLTGVNAAVATALDGRTGDLRLFSAITGAWHTAPAPALRVLPELARNGALLVDANLSTCWAFSARSGRFFARSNGPRAALQVDPASSLMAVEDDGALAVFEARREVWIDTPITAADRPLSLRIWRTTLVAFTPTEAIGYGALHGAIERASLPGTLNDFRASSEVGAAITSAGVLGYSAVADLRTEAQFPEFRRMTGRGAPVDVEVVGPPNALVGALAGFPRGQATAVPGIGTLTLDPAVLVPLTIGALDLDGFASLRLPIPDTPALQGLELGMQAIVVPPSANPYLTRMSTFRVH